MCNGQILAGCRKRRYSVNTLLIQLYNHNFSILTVKKKKKGSFTSLATAVIAGEFDKISKEYTNQLKILDVLSSEQNASGFSLIFTSVNWEFGILSPMVEFPQIAMWGGKIR